MTRKYTFDNTAPSASLGQDDLTTWNDISGNGYDARLENGNWNSSYNGYNGIATFVPDSGDIYQTELFEEIVRDSFINENYYGRTMFKSNFTVEMFIKINAAGTLHLYTIDSPTGGHTMKYNFTSAGYHAFAASYIYNRDDNIYDITCYLDGQVSECLVTDPINNSKIEGINPEIDTIIFGNL